MKFTAWVMGLSVGVYVVAGVVSLLGLGVFAVASSAAAVDSEAPSLVDVVDVPDWDPADSTRTDAEWNSRITVDMDVLSERCGTDGQYVVKFLNIDGYPGGRVVTQVVTDCP